MRFTRLILIMFCAAVALYGCNDTRKQDIERFVKGNAAYKDGDYKAAIKSYQAIINSGLSSMPVNYNLGNAFMKEGELGRALAAYERALLSEPRDSDLNANFAFARGQMGNPEPKPAKGSIFIHLKMVTLDEIVLILTFLGVGISAVFLAGLFFRWRFHKTAIFIGLLTALFVFHVFALLAKMDALKDRAIVIKTADVKYEPEDNATTHFIANEGWKVRILKKSAGWTKVERPDGLEGWIPSGTLEEI